MTPKSLQLTLFSQALHANPSQSLVSEQEWLTRVVTWHSSFLDLLTAFAPAGWSGKTCPVFYPAYLTKLPIRVRRRHQWIWSATDKKWKLKTTTEQKNYMPSTASWPDFQNSATGGPCGFLTLNTPEFHSAAVASSLSDILETGDVPQRYFLSDTACRGIIRRAEKRGRELPAHLLAALKMKKNVSQCEPIKQGQTDSE